MSFAKFFERRCRCRRWDNLTLRQPCQSQKGGDGTGENVRKLPGGSVGHFNMFLFHGLKRSWMAEVAERIGNQGSVIGWTKGSRFGRAGKSAGRRPVQVLRAVWAG